MYLWLPDDGSAEMEFDFVFSKQREREPTYHVTPRSSPRRGGLFQPFLLMYFSAPRSASSPSMNPTSASLDGPTTDVVLFVESFVLCPAKSRAAFVFYYPSRQPRM